MDLKRWWFDHWCYIHLRWFCFANLVIKGWGGWRIFYYPSLPSCKKTKTSTSSILFWRTRFSSKVSGWGVGVGKVKLLLRKKRFKCQFELSKPLLTNKVILGSNGSNTHYFANPEFSEELKQITRHVWFSTFSFRSQFGHRWARKATAELF